MAEGIEVRSRRVTVRAALLDLVSQAGAEGGQGLGADDAAFLAALRAVVEQAPPSSPFNRLDRSAADVPSRIFARFAD